MGFRNIRPAAEDGIALPLALMVLLAVTVLAFVAASAAISARHQTFRDANAKRSYQAAASGVQSANYQTTLLKPDLQQCVVKDAATGALSVAAVTNGWCAPQVEQLGDGATYTEQVSAGTLVESNGQQLVQREIVSTGIVNGVKRRVDVTTSATTAKTLFPAGYAVVSLASVSYGNTVRVDGGVGSNGDISLSNEAVICGNATPGPGGEVTEVNSGHVCAGYSKAPAEQPFRLDPVDQGTARTVNDNVRITNALSTAKPKPSPSDSCTTCAKIGWDPATRVLALSGNATLTLGGGIYSFCKLTLDNSAQLKVAVNAAVKIYVDSPEACGGSGMGSVALNNTSGIVNLNSSPSALQLYLVGSPSIPTILDFANVFTSTILMAIYAPYSTVYLHNNVHITGAIAANSIPIENNSSITYDSRIGDITGGSIPVYRSTRRWIECTATPTGAQVNSGC
jgi:Tfp pilus assembly protein PilX